VFLILGYILIIGLVYTFIQKTPKGKKIFLILASLVLFFIAAFRSVYFGPDVIRYVQSYEMLKLEKISYLWSNFIENEGRDPFFYFFSKLISITGANSQVWLALISGIFIFSITKLIYEYSSNFFLSYVAFISLGYFYFSITGIRQSLAIALVVISYNYLRNRKFWRFLLIVSFASLFHSSALIFLIAYPLSNIKIGYKQFIGIFSSLFIATYFGQEVRVLIGIIGWTENLADYATHNYYLNRTGFFIQLCIYLFCLYYKEDILKLNEKNVSFYNLLFIGLIFQSFATVVAEFFRISMYFSVFSIVLIPYALSIERNKKFRLLLSFTLFFVLFVYIFWSGSFKGFILL